MGGRFSNNTHDAKTSYRHRPSPVERLLLQAAYTNVARENNSQRPPPEGPPVCHSYVAHIHCRCCAGQFTLRAVSWIHPVGCRGRGVRRMRLALLAETTTYPFPVVGLLFHRAYTIVGKAWVLFKDVL